MFDLYFILIDTHLYILKIRPVICKCKFTEKLFKEIIIYLSFIANSDEMRLVISATGKLQTRYNNGNITGLHILYNKIQFQFYLF